MPDPQWVTIRHPKTLVEYSILPADFSRAKVSPDGETYAEQGFHIIGYSDGTPYDGPKTLREIERAQEARQAAREQRAAAKPSDRPADTKREGT